MRRSRECDLLSLPHSCCLPLSISRITNQITATAVPACLPACLDYIHTQVPAAVHQPVPAEQLEGRLWAGGGNYKIRVQVHPPLQHSLPQCFRSGATLSMCCVGGTPSIPCCPPLYL